MLIQDLVSNEKTDDVLQIEKVVAIARMERGSHDWRGDGTMRRVYGIERRGNGK